jgi:putative flippase GtrA
VRVLAAALMRDETFVRFVKFVLVGILNTAFGYLLYVLLVLIGLPPQFALALSYACGIVWNFFTHARLVFDHQGFGRLPHYAAAYLLLYGGNAIALEGLTRLGLPPLLAQAVILPFAAASAFILISRVLTGRFPLLPIPR